MRVDFVYGEDEFLVGRKASQLLQEFLDEHSQFQPEILDGSFSSVAESRDFLVQFSESIHTLPLFGADKIIWIKSLSFLADAPSENQQKWVDEFFLMISEAKAVGIPLILSASPVDRRLKNFKFLVKNSDVYEISGNPETLAQCMVEDEVKRLGLRFPEPLRATFLEKVGLDTRSISNEIEKIDLYLGNAREVTLDLISNLACEGPEENFFETVEAFYSGNRRLLAESLRRYFALYSDGRPLITALQNRNRLLLQLSLLQRLGVWQVGLSGFYKKVPFQEFREKMEPHFRDFQEKTTCNIFSQNPWYLQRLHPILERFSFESLLKIQQSWGRLFSKFVANYDQQSVLLEEYLQKMQALAQPA